MQPTTSTKQLSSFQEAFQRNVPLRQGKGGAPGWRVFAATNEIGTDKTLKKLTHEPLNGSAFLGVSGFFSLNAVSVRGTGNNDSLKYIVILDLSTHVKLFWSEIEKIMGKVTTRTEFIKELEKLPLQNPERFYPPIASVSSLQFAKDDTQEVKREIQSGESWLSSDARFNKIRKIFSEKHFVFVQGSFSDPTVTKGIADALESQGIRIDSIYTSNVREYVEYFTPNEADGIPKFRDSFQKLFPVTSDETLLIDCEARPGGAKKEKDSRLVQRVFTDIRKTNIKLVIPFSPGTKEDLESARALVNKAFPAGMPADPRLRLYWCAFVVYVLIKAKIFNVE